MAESLAHTFGQIVGNVLEEVMEPQLRKFSLEHGLYLDKQGPRRARDGKKVTWTDLYGNAHDLDFVADTYPRFRGLTAAASLKPVSSSEGQAGSGMQAGSGSGMSIDLSSPHNNGGIRREKFLSARRRTSSGRA